MLVVVAEGVAILLAVNSVAVAFLVLFAFVTRDWKLLSDSGLANRSQYFGVSLQNSKLYFSQRASTWHIPIWFYTPKRILESFCKFLLNKVL